MRFTISSIAVLYLLLLTACNTQSSNPDGLERTCVELQAISSAGMPLDEITIDGIPETMELLFGEVRSITTGESILTAVEPLGEGRVTVTVPLHPDLSPDGGEAELIIKNDSVSCPAVPITIEPLPQAQGAFAESVQVLEARLREVLTSEGNSVEDYYRQDLTTVPRHLLPYATVHSLIMHPDNAESVLAVASGNATSIDGVEVDTELLDRITARVGLLEMIRDMPLLFPSQPGSVTSQVFQLEQQDVPDMGCSSGDFHLVPAGTTQDLSKRMRRQSESEAYMKGAAAKVQGDLAMLTGMAASSKHPVVSPIAKTLTLTLTKSQTMTDIVQNLFPKDLEPQLFLSPAAFNEDDPGPGTWTLLAIATSDPWNLNKEVFKYALEKGLADASIGEQLFSSEVLKNPAYSQIASEIDNYALKKPTSQALSTLMDAIGANEDGVGFHVPAGCWDGENHRGTIFPMSSGQM